MSIQAGEASSLPQYSIAHIQNCYFAEGYFGEGYFEEG